MAKVMVQNVREHVVDLEEGVLLPGRSDTVEKSQFIDSQLEAGVLVLVDEPKVVETKKSKES